MLEHVVKKVQFSQVNGYDYPRFSMKKTWLEYLGITPATPFVDVEVLEDRIIVRKKANQKIN